MTVEFVVIVLVTAGFLTFVGWLAQHNCVFYETPETRSAAGRDARPNVQQHETQRIVPGDDAARGGN